MIELVARWFAGASDWHALPAYEIVLERTGAEWRVTFLVHGEAHGLVGFESESEAREDITHLMKRCPPEMLPWAEAVLPGPDAI